MEGFDIKPGRGRRIFAALLVVGAVFDAVTGPLSARVLSAAGVLIAYDLAFLPSPPLNLRLRDIYAMARQGWRMCWTSKILSAAVIVLVVTSVYLQLQGR